MIGQLRLLSFLLLFSFIILTLVGFGLFSTQLFPIKRLYNLPESLPSPQKERRFGKVVFMLIDALRPDFVYNTTSRFTTLQRLIKSGAAIPYIARVQPPTVTTQRVKCLAIGHNPEFFDFLWSPLFIKSNDTGEIGHLDNVISRIHKAGNDIFFYGDGTWVKQLGSKVFTKSDGEYELAVTDHIIVDYNVTRHLGPDLFRKKSFSEVEWDLLMLHYLGIDHIGHHIGPNNDIMKAKFDEMNIIVSSIYDKLTELDKVERETNPHALPSLFVVLGDHGMTNSGSHGGVDPLEANAAVLFISNAFIPKDSISAKKSENISPKRIEQSDICATLADVFEVGVPTNNIGTSVTDIFRFKNVLYDGDDEYTILKRIAENSKQIRTLLSKLKFSNEKEEKLFSNAHMHYMRLNKDTDARIIKESLQHFQNYTRYGFELVTSSLLQDKTALVRNLSPCFLLVSLSFLLCCGVLFSLLKHSLFERKLSYQKHFSHVFFVLAVFFLTLLLASILFMTNVIHIYNTTLNILLTMLTALFTSVSVLAFIQRNHLLFFLFPRKWTSQESVVHPIDNEAERFNERVKWILLLMFLGLFFIVQPFFGFGTSHIVNEKFYWKLLLSSYLVIGLLLKVILRWKIQSNELTINFGILVLLRLVTFWENSGKNLSHTYLTVCSAICTIALILILDYYFHNHAFKQLDESTFRVFEMMYGILLGLSFLIVFFPNVLSYVLPFSASTTRFVVICCSAILFLASSFLPLAFQRGVRAKGFQLHVFFVLMLYSLLPAIFLIQRPCNIPLLFLWCLIGALFVQLCFVENVSWLTITEKTVSCFPSPCTLLHRTLCRSLILWVFGRVAFFSFGNGNSISDIEIQTVYEGLPFDSNKILFVLGFLSVYTGPILFFFLSQTILMMESEYQEITIHNAFEQTIHMTSFALLARAIFQVLIEMIVMAERQGELFIWTCFAPKFLFDCAEVTLTFVLVIFQCFFSSILNVLFLNHRKFEQLE